MTNKEVYKIWAPYNKKWVDWVRPVYFIHINEDVKKATEIVNLDFKEKITYLDNPEFKNAAIIVDLFGIDSVKEGLQLAKEKGYRPIPVYNGTDAQDGVLSSSDNDSIKIGLLWGASILKNIEIKDDALPCFMLNTERLQRIKRTEKVFDNSWDIYHQDLPTPNYFVKNNIDKVIVVTTKKKIVVDLKRLLYPFTKKGLKVYICNGYDEPKEVTLRKPKDYREDI